MRLLLVSNVFPPGFIGGYELGALDIASELARRGHEVNVLTSNYFLDDDHTLSFEVERSLDCLALSHRTLRNPTAPKEGVFDCWDNVRRIASALRRHRPEIVILFNTAGLGAYSITKFVHACRVPFITYLMDNVFGDARGFPNELRQYERVFGTLQANELGSVVAMSRNLLREVGEQVPGVSSVATIVPGWVKLAREDAGGGPVREADGRTRFVFSGRVAGHKGIDLLLEATGRLCDQGRRNFAVDIYGAGSVGPVMQEVQRRNLSDVISYKGVLAKDEMVGRFAEYDALLFPTWEREPFGFTASEAVGRGCVPIMTGGIGAAEWFLDGVDCFKIQRNVESLQGAMLRLMELPPTRLAALKEAARTNVARSLEMTRWMDRIEEICTEVRGSLPAWSPKRVSQLESSFLILSEMWREGF